MEIEILEWGAGTIRRQAGIIGWPQGAIGGFGDFLLAGCLSSPEYSISIYRRVNDPISKVQFPLTSAFSAGRLQEYQVIGRKLPSDADPTPKLYRMRLFAPNSVVAKSRFWYFLKKLRKVKKANGEIVSLNEVWAFPPCVVAAPRHQKGCW